MENIYTLYEHYEPSQRILFGRYMAQMNPFDYKIIWLPFICKSRNLQTLIEYMYLPKDNTVNGRRLNSLVSLKKAK